MRVNRLFGKDLTEFLHGIDEDSFHSVLTKVYVLDVRSARESLTKLP